jgi:glycosyltransferase involved in cell wall biosynthesis
MAKRRGARTILDVITLHNDDFRAAMKQGTDQLSVPPIQHPSLVKRIEQEYQKADLLRVMSTPARNTFLARGFSPSRVFVAAPPVDLPDIPADRREPDPFIVSYVGLLEPAKGFHLLIEAFRKLNRPDTRLWLWGNTGTRNLANYMRQQMTECPRIELKSGSVRALGHEKVYGASSVLVHPSLADGFGYVVSEAMAAGIPVITTTATGASEWIEDGVSGYVVAPGDAEAIRERLQQLIDSPALRRDMGQKAREAMRPLTIERMRNCYRQALSTL